MKNFKIYVKVIIIFIFTHSAIFASENISFEIKKIDAGNNSFSPFFDYNEGILYWTGETEEQELKTFFTNFYSNNLELDDKSIETFFNDNGNKGHISISSDGKTMVYGNMTTLGQDTLYEIIVSKKVDNEWICLDTLSFNSFTAYPVISPDGSSIYFSSFMEDISNADRGSFGGLDLYKVNINNDGNFGRFINLGNNINTPFNEVTPFVIDFKVHSVLFFSSNKPGGMGKSDIYFSMFKNEVFSSPETLKNINSPEEDAFFSAPQKTGKYNFAFFASGRDKSLELYSVNPLPVKERVMELKGKIYDDEKHGNLIPGATIRIQSNNSPDVIEIITDSSGTYSTDIPLGDTVRIRAYADNKAEKNVTVFAVDGIRKNNFEYINDFHLSDRDVITIKPSIVDSVPLTKAELIEPEIAVIEKVVIPETVIALPEPVMVIEPVILPMPVEVIEPVTPPVQNDEFFFYFDYNEYILKLNNKGIEYLNDLADRLVKNPTTKIIIDGHTDNVGSTGSNKELSKKRAEAVRSELLKISDSIKKQIKIRGKGESELLKKECGECAENRRVEIIFGGD